VTEHKTVEVVLENGERASAQRYVSGVLELICPRAFAPGQPMQLTVVATEPSFTLVGKSAGSKRRSDGAFDVRLRLHSLRREAREWLEQTFLERA
jgi:hypothetical protein